MYYDREKNQVCVSVRELCSLALMGGSLDSRIPPRSLYLRATEGREVHENLRRRYEQEIREAAPRPAPLRGSEMPPVSEDESLKPSFRAEVPLSHVCHGDAVDISVSGRADGVWYDPAGGWTVEEIKSVTTAADFYLRSPRAADLAQLSCYAYFLCVEKGLSAVTLRLTYARAGEEDEAVHVDSVKSVVELFNYYTALVCMISDRAADLAKRETTVRDAAKSAVFPYPAMRAAQEDMILECWRDIRAGKTVFAQAPTGIGKTISTLYPAVRCFGEGRCDKIFYLTAKNATRREAFGAMQKLCESGTPLRACVITAREAACLCDAAKTGGGRISAYCNPDACPYAKGYYDRVEPAIQELLSSGKSIYGGLDIRATAKEWKICPYELALDLSERCEVIICDYNYVFSPSVCLRRYFSDGIPHTEGHRYVFLVDEAHNLADRARDTYSGEISLATVVEAQHILQEFEDQAQKVLFPHEDGLLSDESDRRYRLRATDLDDLVGVLSRMAGVCTENLVTHADGVKRGAALDRGEPVELCDAVRTLSARCDRWLRRNPRHPLYHAVDGFSSCLRAFSTVSDYYDRHFVTYVEVEGEDVRVRLVCLDPSGILRPILQRAVSRILFSATLTPADYFADILGGDRNSVRVSFDSPFPTDHLCVAVADKISTRFEDRDSSYRRVVSYIAATVSAKKGNYMVYFPSYDYMEKTYALFARKYPKVKTVVQKRNMTYVEREAFIAAFTPDSDRLQIGFCVLGGSFSEGVDLPGRCLIGAVIVGVGIPGLSSERNIMREYYDEQRDGEGYAYAYTYPGMNHVLQAAGRVIRRPEDRGVVVLLDDRYMGEPYLHLYPSHWEGMAAVGDPASLAAHLTDFWAHSEDDTTS